MWEEDVEVRRVELEIIGCGERELGDHGVRWYLKGQVEHVDDLVGSGDKTQHEVRWRSYCHILDWITTIWRMLTLTNMFRVYWALWIWLISAILLHTFLLSDSEQGWLRRRCGACKVAGLRSSGVAKLRLWQCVPGHIKLLLRCIAGSSDAWRRVLDVVVVPILNEVPIVVASILFELSWV